MLRTCLLCVVLAAMAEAALGATYHVPADQPTIQAAVDVAAAGDMIVVTPGVYRETIRLKPHIVVRSAGDDTPGKVGLNRAEATILNADRKPNVSGVEMAEGSVLDGFTVTGVGVYDEAVWNKHFTSRGEELGDEEGAMQAEGTHPAIRIDRVACTVRHCLVHHNGDVGIGVVGRPASQAAPLVVGNQVFRNLGGGIGVAEGAEPIIRGNTCYENLRAGIGCREGARPIVRGNQCYQNRRAGIGIRMPGTAPIVEDNICHENGMAGIGCRDGASPTLRNNVCHNNQLAGIGAQQGARPLIVGNECRDNEQAGIGVQRGATAIIHANTCFDNKLVAIGITEASTATITENELSRTGGPAPIIAVRDGSVATIRNNQIAGGGVAALMVQGQTLVDGNSFTAAADRQGQAIWVREGSSATIAGNDFTGYRVAVQATQASVQVIGNTIRQFETTAIVVKSDQRPAHVYGNTAISSHRNAQVVDVQGPAGVVAENVLKQE